MKWIEVAEQSCRERLQQPELKAVEAALALDGVTPQQCLAWLNAVSEVPSSQAPITRLRTSLVERGLLSNESYALERYLLLLAVRRAIPLVTALRTGPDVHRLFAEAFSFFAEPDARSVERLRCGGQDYESMCKVATLRRFPAGQFEWEVTGLPRSWLVKVRPGSVAGLLKTIAFDLGGLKPMIFPHFAVCGPRRIVMREGEVKRSFFRMAIAMEMQPEMRGFLAGAWFLSPDAVRVNPQLSWFIPFFEQHGAFVTTMGHVELGPRQLARNDALREEYERGEFRPRLGVVVWPRKAMLRWAARYTEAGDSRGASPTPQTMSTATTAVT